MNIISESYANDNGISTLFAANSNTDEGDNPNDKAGNNGAASPAIISMTDLAAAARDEQVQQRLDTIVSGWPPSQLSNFLEGFFQELALDGSSLSATVINEYLDLLLQKLKRKGYSPLGKAQYRSMLNKALKGVQALRRPAPEDKDPRDGQKGPI